jgi:hypothetical protein
MTEASNETLVCCNCCCPGESASSASDTFTAASAAIASLGTGTETDGADVVSLVRQFSRFCLILLVFYQLQSHRTARVVEQAGEALLKAAESGDVDEVRQLFEKAKAGKDGFTTGDLKKARSPRPVVMASEPTTARGEGGRERRGKRRGSERGKDAGEGRGGRR